MQERGRLRGAEHRRPLPIDPARRLAGAAALVLLLAACGTAPDGAPPVGDVPAEVASDAAAPDADAASAPAPDPAPDAEPDAAPAVEPDADTDADTEADADADADADAPSDPGSHPFDTTNPDLGWPFAADVEAVLAHAAAANAAFDAGVEAGFAFQAAHSWPDGFTADALLACRVDEPTPTWAELDARGYRVRFTIVSPLPAPYFRYPPTGELPFDAGLRVYVVLYRAETIVDGDIVNSFQDPARAAVRPDGTVTMFPTCFEYLPGEILAHRVTDGDVGGYTDAEAAGDVRFIMTNSPREAQLEVCGLLDTGDLATIAEMILPPDVEAAGLRIPRAVLEATLPELCAALRT